MAEQHSQASNEQQELTLEQALAAARELHQGEHYEAAEELYQRIHEAAPNHPEPLNFLAILAYQKSNYPQAIDYLQRALVVMPDNADLYNNLGNLHKMLNQREQAFSAYQKALELNPTLAHAHNNLAILYRQENQIEPAIAAYQQAIALQPELIDLYFNLGNLYADQGQLEQATAAFQKSLDIDDNYLEGYKALGQVLSEQQRFAEAADIYRRLLAKSPAHPIAEHMLAMCTQQQVPDRASDDYVQSLFDNFADTFEEKLSVLKYRAPELVADALAQRVTKPAHELHILDAGCGTGWCGPLLQPYARKLIGVDLSPGMLAKANERGYDELISAELDHYMRSHPATFDAIISADTLIYFGALEQVLASAAQALKPQSWLIFTLEKTAEDTATEGFHMTNSGRYSHKRSYVEQCLRGAGFDALDINDMHARLQHGRPVLGMLIAARSGTSA